MLLKNTAGQFVVVYVHDTLSDSAKTGYAASLTGWISKDGGTFVEIGAHPHNPTELAFGFYKFELTQAEANANNIIVTAVPASTQFVVTPAVLQTDNGLAAASKVLTNKAIQNKTTGAVVYYDNDGVTPILTHTPADGETTITRTPS